MARVSVLMCHIMVESGGGGGALLEVDAEDWVLTPDFSLECLTGSFFLRNKKFQPLSSFGSSPELDLYSI